MAKNKTLNSKKKLVVAMADSDLQVCLGLAQSYLKIRGVLKGWAGVVRQTPKAP